MIPTPQPLDPSTLIKESNLHERLELHQPKIEIKQKDQEEAIKMPNHLQKMGF